MKKRVSARRARGPKGKVRMEQSGRQSKRKERMEQNRQTVRTATLVPGMTISGMLLTDRRPKLIPLAGGAGTRVWITEDWSDCMHGDIVRAEVTAREGKRAYIARIVSRISQGSDALSRVKAMAVGFGLRLAFDAQTLEEAAEASAQPLSMDNPARYDFRKMETFTIDGADAKDFDDAVGIGDAPAGLTRLYVHIADVSHYVRQGTPMDEEALARGTSVYFPNLVLPMLPEALSNGCCSLRPGEDRFTLSCVMDIDASGQVRDSHITRGAIRSARRFTYDEVNALFAHEQAMQTCPQGAALLRLRALARTLNQRRRARGSVEIDLPEARIAVDGQGEVTDVTAPDRGEAERLIEECMLVANETVARFLRERALPGLYRVHEQPDPEKVDLLKRFAKKAGLMVKGLRHPVTSDKLAALLEQAKGTPVYPTLAMLTMRSMQKACYDASPRGHFALAAPDYCHFTSPIRRYPDLFVHRAIKSMLDGDSQAQKKLRLIAEETARQSSEREMVAMDAERAVDKMMMARWASAHTGETFPARVSGVTSAGFFAMLPNCVEGMVPVWSLRDEWICDEEAQVLRGVHTGVRYTVGMNVSVRIDSVQEALGRIDLTLIEPEGGTRQRGETKNRGSEENA